MNVLSILLIVFAQLSSGVGTASYYDDGPGAYAAVNSFRWGDKPYPLEVCRADDSSRCVSVIVRDHCQCYVDTPDERLIDLSPDAFREIAPRTDGLVKVRIGRVSIPLPETDTC